MNDFVYEEQKQLIEMWKSKYYEQKEEKEKLNNIIKEQGLEDKPNYYVKGLEGSLKEYQQEVMRLNNIINELKEWFKGYHKSYASCKWYEEDYIEFIEHLEKELKGSDKE